MILFAYLVLKGLALAKRISTTVKLCLSMHTSMEIPLSKSNLNDIAMLLEILKAMVLTSY